MRIKKSDTLRQRQVIEKKLTAWRTVSRERKPPIGWIKAIRGALGITTQQLADHMQIDQAGIVRLEKREREGSISLDTLERTAKAMHCKVVYAIVPDDGFLNLEEIIDQQAEAAAKMLMKKVSHSMRLEKQGVANDDKQAQLKRFVRELKEKLDPKIWNVK